MTNIMKMGATMLSATRHVSMVESVTYKRGSLSVDLSATIGRVGTDQQDTEGMIVDLEGVDFIIRADDLVLGAVSTIPRDGDTIEYDPGSGVVVYQVRRDETDEVFRPCDEYGLDIRIHTKRMGA